MEKEEQNWEQTEMSQEEEEEGSTLVVRKSRNSNESKFTEIAAVDDGEVITNGASESNGQAENGARIENLLINSENEQKNRVLENEPEAINGEQKKENLVFFDKAEGVDSHHGPEKSDISSTLDFVVQNNSTTTINNNYEDDLENNTISSSNHQPSQTSSLEHNTSYNKPSKEIEENAEFDLLGDDDLEVNELDVESVIKKQTTHDLFCPNCNSCITRRVILRKRKRRVRVSDDEVKRNKTENAVLGKGPVQSRGDHVHDTGAVDGGDAEIETVGEDERVRGPDVFRCLSCFSFFIPTGNGFKLFKLFGDKSGKDKIDNEQSPSVKKNWFNSMFGLNKPETAVEQGSSFQTDVRQSHVQVISSSNIGDQIGQPLFSQIVPSPARASEELVGTAGNNDTLVEDGDKILPSPKQKHSLNEKSINVAGDKFDATRNEAADATTKQFDSYTEDQSKESNYSKEVHVSREISSSVTTFHMRTQVTNAESAEDALSFSQQGGLKFMISSNNGSLLNSEEGKITNETMQSGGKDTVITIDSQPAGLSQTVQNITSLSETASLLQSSTQTNIVGRERTGERKDYGIEVIKSIVYGGLAESITSLSVVSSAAGGGAATLNILALGMANLIGGLFIICQNLWELKCDNRVDQPTNQISDQVDEQNDRYNELLGRRRNFILHAVVSIISYLVFGLVPPVVYGFSFRKTDDKHLKLVVVAAASLACIVVLAVGRAHVRRTPKPYLKSVMTFVVLGFMVSGVSYAAGELVERLLEKLGLFETSSINNLLVDEMMMMMRPMGSAWSSY